MSDDAIDSLTNQAHFAKEVENHVKKENQGNWRPLPYEPFYCDYHPCPHRWFKIHNEPRPPRKARYKDRELSERLVWLAHPLLRRLLWLWICHANTLPADRRDRLKAMLISYGYTDEELERYILEENNRNKRVKKTIEEEGHQVTGPVVTDEEDVQEDEDEEGEGGKAKKKRREGKEKIRSDKVAKPGKGKAGKPGNGWPHAIGTKLFLWLWTTLMSPPDEVFLSRAREYFDVQAGLLLEICTEAMGKPIAHDASGCSFEQKVAIACLNLAVCIAKNIVAPAQEIADEDVENLLKLRGGLPKPAKERKSNPKSKSKKKSKQKKEQAKEPEIKPKTENPAVINKINEGWTESTLPLSRMRQPSVIEDPIECFKKMLIWYNPREPEFMYNGLRLFPSDLKIMEHEETLWCIESFTVPPEKIVPEPIPPYFESFRQTVYSYSNNNKDEEKPQPWYIMSESSYYEAGPRIADMASIVELTDIFFHMVEKMLSMPDLSMTALLEMLKQQADVADSVVEHVGKEDALLDNKRTVILHRLYADFFGLSFRDYNDQTWDIMHSLCHRAAVMIRHVYRHTAHTLWTLQCRDVSKIERKQSLEIPPDDPDMLEAWDDWLAWLARICSLAKEWAGWLEDCDGDLMELAIRMKPKPFNKWVSKARGEAEQWYDKLDEIYETDKYYAENAEFLGQVNSRPLPGEFFYEKRYPDKGRSLSSVTNTYDWASNVSQHNRSRAATKASIKF